MRIGSLFTGYGGLDLAAEEWFGARTVWTSDIDPGACKIIAHRFPHAPNLGDVAEIDWPAVERVEVLTGGFPCQDVSQIGRRLGIRPGTRSGLWAWMAYAINQLRPQYVVAENVRGLLSAAAHSDLEPCPWCLGGAGHHEPDLRALGAVLGDLAALRYDARWIGLRAADVGAPHERFRVFIVATDTDREPQLGDAGELGTPARAQQRSRLTDHGAAIRGATLPHPGVASTGVDSWGAYAGSVRRWSEFTGRPAPDPGADQPAIAEWMMGLPAGWVTEVPGLSMSAKNRALGNGVVPQQAYEALRRALG